MLEDNSPLPAQSLLQTGTTRSPLLFTPASEIRGALLARREIALLDVREEAMHAEGHPLFAANLPLSRLELEAWIRLPRRSVPIVVFDDGEEIAPLAARRLIALGYSNVSILEGGLRGWRDAGFEIFRDVNVPSKAFGELVEHQCQTPSLAAEDVAQLLAAGADIFIADARRYEEFQAMSIPTAVSVPGGELVLRLQSMALRPSTQVIVNCAGRTRSIIGTQSLINARLPNPVAALRNGTIGWKLAHQLLDHGASRVLALPGLIEREQAIAAARRVADAAGVRRVLLAELRQWSAADHRTLYCFDVRAAEEYSVGHLPGFRLAPGGQLIQETDMFVPVRGARIILADSDGARANMTGSWLAQMNWEVYILDGTDSEDFSAIDSDLPVPPSSDIPASRRISSQTLHRRLQASSERESIVVLDFSRSREYIRAHIPGACFALRSRISEALDATKGSGNYVITSSDELLSALAWAEVTAATSTPCYLLEGGNRAWKKSGYPLQSSPRSFASQPLDNYKRPYEGTEIPPELMQAYLDWEYGLVEQLERDGTHGFRVLATPP